MRAVSSAGNEQAVRKALNDRIHRCLVALARRLSRTLDDRIGVVLVQEPRMTALYHFLFSVFICLRQVLPRTVVNWDLPLYDIGLSPGNRQRS
jgi:hypothetical protein